MTPAEVCPKNADQVFYNLYGTIPARQKIKMQFKRGDLLRISKLRGVFDKKYKQSFTDETFTVARALQHSPPVYKPIEGSFYEAELQKVKKCFMWRKF